MLFNRLWRYIIGIGLASANTDLPPIYRIQLEDAEKVRGVVITSSPFPIHAA